MDHATNDVSDRLAMVKVAIFAGLAGAIAYLSLAPADYTPTSGLFWDKAQHGLAYLVLTAMGLVFFPRRSRLVFFGIIAFGIGIELAQSLMGLGRQGDWRDALANSTGALIGLRGVQLARRWRRPRDVTSLPL